MEGKYKLVMSYETAWRLEKKQPPLVIDGDEVEYTFAPNPWCPTHTIYVFNPKGEWVVTLKHKESK